MEETSLNWIKVCVWMTQKMVLIMKWKAMHTIAITKAKVREECKFVCYWNCYSTDEIVTFPFCTRLLFVCDSLFFRSKFTFCLFVSLFRLMLRSCAVHHHKNCWRRGGHLTHFLTDSWGGWKGNDDDGFQQWSAYSRITGKIKSTHGHTYR